MNINDLYIIIKAILWYQNEPSVPSYDEIIKFINYHKNKLERIDNNEKKNNF